MSIVSGVSAMDDPKQLINRFVEELWNERRLDVADAIFARAPGTRDFMWICSSKSLFPGKVLSPLLRMP